MKVLASSTNELQQTNKQTNRPPRPQNLWVIRDLGLLRDILTNCNVLTYLDPESNKQIKENLIDIYDVTGI